eukprot:1824884-Rhodomonas_salina.1
MFLVRCRLFQGAHSRVARTLDDGDDEWLTCSATCPGQHSSGVGWEYKLVDFGTATFGGFGSERVGLPSFVLPGTEPSVPPSLRKTFSDLDLYVAPRAPSSRPTCPFRCASFPFSLSPFLPLPRWSPPRRLA